MKKYVDPPRLSASFSKSGKCAKKRFENILDTRIKKKGYASLAAAVACIAVLGGCFTAGGVSDEPVNILIAGKDASGERSDVLLMCSLNDTLNIEQIPRNTYTSVNGGTVIGRLDDSGSMLEAAAEITGIYADSCISVSFDGFRALIDAVGGVDITVPADMYYEDPYQGLVIDLPTGEQHLDGAGAEMLMRYRKGMPDENGVIDGYARGDLDRLDVQRELYYAVADKLLSEGVSAELAAAVSENTVSDMSVQDIAGVIKRASKLSPGDIKIETIKGYVSSGGLMGETYIPEQGDNL